MTFDQIMELVTALGVIVALGANAVAYALVARRARADDYRDDKYRYSYGPYGSGTTYGPYGTPLRDMVVVMIAQAEREFSILLTPAAREMLIIPVIEAAQDAPREFNFQEAQRSIFGIVESIAQGGVKTEHRGRGYNAQSVVRAFWRKFCNIPPFCDGEGPKS